MCDDTGPSQYSLLLLNLPILCLYMNFIFIKSTFIRGHLKIQFANIKYRSSLNFNARHLNSYTETKISLSDIDE